jgi:hypothetical protein
MHGFKRAPKVLKRAASSEHTHYGAEQLFRGTFAEKMHLPLSTNGMKSRAYCKY